MSRDFDEHFWEKFSVLDDTKNQECRVTPVEWKSGGSCLVPLLWEFLSRFLWIGRIRHSGHLGIKPWINNTIPQVWVPQVFFWQLLLFDYAEMFVKKSVISY